MTPDQMPRCVCTAHPPEDSSGRQWMRVAEERSDFVVFQCVRCTEITRTPVIQVRTLSLRDQAQYATHQSRRQMDPRLLQMIEQRKRGRMRYRKEEEQNA